MIRFKLNEKGSILKSEARLKDKLGRRPLAIIFNKPFLIYLKQKDAQYPYFAMWVDNSELLMKESSEFSIYLLAEEIPSVGGIPQWPNVDLNKLKLQDSPIISINDIISYKKETHEIELTKSARKRIGQLKVSLRGLPFVVCIGRNPIYPGAFWTPFSSLSFPGVVIMPIWHGKKKEGIIQLETGYPSSKAFKYEDHRSDQIILDSLEQAGKLK